MFDALYINKFYNIVLFDFYRCRQQGNCGRIAQSVCFRRVDSLLVSPPGFYCPSRQVGRNVPQTQCLNVTVIRNLDNSAAVLQIRERVCVCSVALPLSTVIGTVIFACRLDREEWVADVISLCRWRLVVIDAALVSLLAF